MKAIYLVAAYASPAGPTPIHFEVLLKPKDTITICRSDAPLPEVEGQTSIGYSPGGTKLLIYEPTISKEHGLVRTALKDGQREIFYEDKNSTNGSYLIKPGTNPQRIAKGERRFQIQDKFRLGPHLKLSLLEVEEENTQAPQVPSAHGPKTIKLIPRQAGQKLEIKSGGKVIK